jgi:acyl dehydratase
MSHQSVLDHLRQRLGTEIHLGEWFEVTQERISAFAEATGDDQWIHVDVERARRELPWHSTVAHGYLILSLLPMLRGSTVAPQGVKRMVNYGLDRLRFANVVRAGSRIRVRSSLLRAEEIAGGVQVAEQCTVEIEGEVKPACVADVIYRMYFE